jgi:hypothetical protein
LIEKPRHGASAFLIPSGMIEEGRGNT